MSDLALADGHRLRFSDLKAGIAGIARRMLTVTLHPLERDGLLTRPLFVREVLPHVEYELTLMGASMLPALEDLLSWIRDNRPRIEACRRSYDESSGVTPFARVVEASSVWVRDCGALPAEAGRSLERSQGPEAI